MLNFDFDDDVVSVDDFLTQLEEEVDLAEKKWNYKYHVNEAMKKGLTRSDAEETVETLIRTKFTAKRCECGEVAQVVDKADGNKIYCGRCWYAKTGRHNNG